MESSSQNRHPRHEQDRLGEPGPGQEQQPMYEDWEQRNNAKSLRIVKKLNFQKIRYVLSRMKLLYVRMPRIIVLLRDRLTVMGMEYDRKQMKIFQMQQTLREIEQKMTMFHQALDENPKSVTDEVIDEVGRNIVTDIHTNDTLTALKAELEALQMEMRKIESKIDYANRFLHTCDVFAVKLNKRFGRFSRNLQNALKTFKDDMNNISDLNRQNA